MTDLPPTMAHPVDVPAAGTDHFDRLVSRIAAGDRQAFRCLYAFLAVEVWYTAICALAHPGHALAVTRSTFIEIWHTAGVTARADARDWVGSMTAFRIEERRRVLGSGIAGQRATDVADYDNHIHRELVDVLGPGHAIVRIGPATFMRVEDLDRAVDAIAANPRPTRAPTVPTASPVAGHAESL